MWHRFMLESWTEAARHRLDADVVASVPARAAQLKEGVPEPGPILPFFGYVLVIHSDSIDVHRYRWPEGRKGRHLGRRVDRLAIHDVTYIRSGRTLAGPRGTVLTVAGTAWFIHGSYERDLHSALRSLGHAGAVEEL
ncbi:MAG: hypothetical protein AAGA90_03755 [Actinomycetota bacterium]